MRLMLLSICCFPFLLKAQNVSLKHHLRMLALGDSYTIGQSVPVNERWPVQLSDSVLSLGVEMDTLRIIATTGWRTDNLLNAITGQQLETQKYNLVSLLIGVNNYYQSQPFSQYITEFPALLDSAIRFAGGEKSHVFVVSIPDYAYTPFGQQSANPSQISAGIDAYNAYNKQVADSAGIAYFDITDISREGINKPAYVANDGLHPSGLQYAWWVNLMLKSMHPEVLTGILKENNAFAQLALYPNPAKDVLEITYKDGSKIKQRSATVYTSTGSLILSQVFYGSSSRIDVSALPAGFYTVKLGDDSGYRVKKVIIEK